MKLIADHCIYDPVLQALSALKFPITSITDLLTERVDYTVMQACLDNNGLLLTLDKGMPSQAYAFEYASKGLSIVLLRWKSGNNEAWQQITEIILRDSRYWIEIAQQETSIISVSYKGGSRSKAWTEISPLIVMHAFTKEVIPPELIDT
ncbi:DUF5615 family PIN-like protein [Chloroflexota bacterium]